MARRISKEGEALIREFEGYAETAYRCPSNVWSIGHGLTGPDIKQGTVWTAEQCERRFQERLRLVEAEVEAMLMNAKVPDTVFDALVSWVWNIGGTAAKKSTLIRKLRKGDLLGAWSELPRWCHGSGGVLLPGLVRRRKKEQDHWNKFLYQRRK
jgi:lysozyme